MPAAGPGASLPLQVDGAGRHARSPGWDPRPRAERGRGEAYDCERRDRRDVSALRHERDNRGEAMEVRSYGGLGPTVIAIHGGPGAPGFLGGLAVELADSFRVIEPFQRGSGAEALTVARHVADLHELIKSRCE